MQWLTIQHIADGLRAKQWSVTELAQSHLDRIRAHDGALGAYLHVMEDDALASATRVDAAIARGDDLSVLAGVPVAVKDTILVAGHPATASSRMLESYVAAYDATAITKLKANDVVFLGKTNCDEFAMGSSTENAALGKTVNAWDAARVPGGSSGGSATAVAADLAVAALGSDTGGSIRQPAALSGVVGLKPTYGHVSRHGLIAMASSFDVIGPFTRCVADARTMFHAMKGKDVLDATSADGSGFMPPVSGLASLRVGIPKEYFGDGMDADVARAVRDAIAVVEGLGCRVQEVSLPLAAYALAVYYVLMPSEVSANLERYDGIRYGASVLRDDEQGVRVTDLKEVYTKTRAAGFGPETKRRIMMGTYALSSGYADAYYKRATAVRNRIKQEYRKAFEGVDVLLTPTTPTPAWKVGEKANDPMQMYLSDIFTVSANVAGVPAMSVPCGFAERDGAKLPIGLQLVGRWFEEDTLFTLGEAYEQATSWHREHPKA
ncbi:MAG: Asp-tRNA(Asn)/Glu-tRNA(Gln) amidotransferase subunit GatA [bacterium]|nr:Asp-tRNA(Asn)/Glu-tRNA(Gln) amidotransferase subunit GatA [bacterium]